MVCLIRGIGGFPLTAMALALGIWGLSGRSAMAQGGAGVPGAGIGGGRMGGEIGISGPGGPLGVGGPPAGNVVGPGGRNVPSDYGYGGSAYSGASVPPAGLYGAPAGGYGPGSGVAGAASSRALVAPTGVYGAPVAAYGPPPGVFGPGYHGFGLDYGYGRGCFPHRQTMKGCSLRAWGSYVLGKECLYPYVADPYSGPAALGFWPPYSAPVAGGAY